MARRGGINQKALDRISRDLDAAKRGVPSGARPNQLFNRTPTEEETFYDSSRYAEASKKSRYAEASKKEEPTEGASDEDLFGYVSSYYPLFDPVEVGHTHEYYQGPSLSSRVSRYMFSLPEGISDSKDALYEYVELRGKDSIGDFEATLYVKWVKGSNISSYSKWQKLPINLIIKSPINNLKTNDFI